MGVNEFHFLNITFPPIFCCCFLVFHLVPFESSYISLASICVSSQLSHLLTICSASNRDVSSSERKIDAGASLHPVASSSKGCTSGLDSMPLLPLFTHSTHKLQQEESYSYRYLMSGCLIQGEPFLCLHNRLLPAPSFPWLTHLMHCRRNIHAKHIHLSQEISFLKVMAASLSSCPNFIHNSIDCNVFVTNLWCKVPKE